MNRRFGAADGLLLLTTLVWGVNFPIGKYVLGFMSPMPFAFFRFLFAAALLMLLLAWRGGVAISWRDAAKLAGLGFIGITLFQTMWSNGLALTTASKAAILVNASPIWAAVYSSFGKNPPTRRAWFGIAVSLAGVFLVINNSLTALNIGGGSFAGDMLLLFGSAFWAAYSTLAGPFLTRLGPLRFTAWSMLFGALCLLPLALPGALAMDYAAIPLRAYLGYGYTIVLSNALGFLWWYESIRQLGVTRAMVYSYLIPLFAIGTAVIFLGEPFSLVQLIGSAVVLAGIRLARGA